MDDYVYIGPPNLIGVNPRLMGWTVSRNFLELMIESYQEEQQKKVEGSTAKCA